MKIFIACSKHFYDRIPEIKLELEKRGHEVSLPNSYDDPLKEEKMKDQGLEAHAKWKSEMLRRDEENIIHKDAILVLNFERKGEQYYIGGATFLEIVKAWEKGKLIYLYNPIPDNIFRDELLGVQPVILEGDLSRIIDVKKGKFQHYKGNYYEVIGVGRHRETLEEFVIYRALYNSEEFGENSLWIRLKKIFMENVLVGGKEVPRFRFVGSN